MYEGCWNDSLHISKDIFWISDELNSEATDFQLHPHNLAKAGQLDDCTPLDISLRLKMYHLKIAVLTCCKHFLFVIWGGKKNLKVWLEVLLKCSSTCFPCVPDRCASDWWQSVSICHWRISKSTVINASDSIGSNRNSKTGMTLKFRAARYSCVQWKSGECNLK